MSHTTTATVRPSRRRALLPLATLLAAASIAMASGATFTSATTNDGNTYAAGTLEQTNSRDGARIFDLSNLKPGDTVTGSVVITNSGTLPAIFTLSEDEVANTFAQKDLLTLTVTDEAGQVVTGRLGGIADTVLPVFAANESRTYTFTATLDPAATNANQGKTAQTTYRWDAVQTAATTTNQ